jgi:transcriptional regulator GlxA family with amidase domain
MQFHSTPPILITPAVGHLVATRAVRAESAREDSGSRSDSRQRRLQHARATLRARYFEPIAMADLAAAACMSMHHFMRCYSAEFGCSAHDELVALRIGLAEHLLTTTKLQVRQIAAAVGFESRTTLFRHFIRHHQRSPEQYRREQAQLDRILRCAAPATALLQRTRMGSALETVREQAERVVLERA